MESAIIDFVSKDKLTNIVKGHDSVDRGIMNLEELKIKYEAEEAIFQHPAILININNLYRRDMTQNELYEATRKHWKINIKKVQKYSLACAVYRGIIREAYVINKWLPSPEPKGRHYFEGQQAPTELREKYRNKSVAKYWKQGSQNSIKYVTKVICP